jgi:hypothetical protein
MSRRRRSHYRPSLGWILGVAFEGTLTRLEWPVQEFTRVRCCGSPRASSPHGLAAPASRVSRRTMLHAVASGSRLLPTRPVKDLHLQSSAHAGHTSAAALRCAARLQPWRCGLTTWRVVNSSTPILVNPSAPFDKPAARAPQRASYRPQPAPIAGQRRRGLQQQAAPFRARLSEPRQVGTGASPADGQISGLTLSTSGGALQ